MQVKARDGATLNREREVSWLQKKAGGGLRQAYGTIRMLAERDVTMTNLHNRKVPLPGDKFEWAPVMILDHPTRRPASSPNASKPDRGLIITRHDWEFLWNQLRSVTAVIKYEHRVADHRIELDTEVSRFYDLADRDEHVDPPPIEP